MAPIDEALADLESQETVNYTATAKKYGVCRTTLSRRHRGKTVSRQEFLSEVQQCLNETQEHVLIRHINLLTDRGMPPTSQIVKNLAEEIIQRPVGKNWVSAFVYRHKDELKSVYLRTMDNLRIKADLPLLSKSTI